MTTKLIDVVRTALQLPEGFDLHDAHGPGTLAEWDSLAHLNIITALEKGYAISISMDEVMTLDSLGEIRKLLVNNGISDS